MRCQYSKTAPEGAVAALVEIVKLDNLLRNTREDFRVFGGELGEDLAVEGEAVLLQLRDESGVGLVALFADSCVKAHYPELAEVSLLVAAVGEGIAASAHKRLVRSVELLRADASVALRAFEDILAALVRYDASFDSCHT